jgi:GNAT superfamily N-acetyltransferase
MATTIGDLDEVRTPAVRWLPAVDPRSVSRDDPHGWYQHALAVESASAAKQVIRLADCHLSPSERDAARTLTPDPAVRNEVDADVVSAMTWSVLAKSDQRVVTHAGILYRVIRVGDVRVPVGGLSRVMTLPEARGRGYARAVVASAAAFVGMWLWAPFALVLCAPECTAFYQALGWRTTNAPIACEQSGRQPALLNRVAMVLPCQGDAAWPAGPIDLCGPRW